MENDKVGRFFGTQCIYAARRIEPNDNCYRPTIYTQRNVDSQFVSYQSPNNIALVTYSGAYLGSFALAPYIVVIIK